MSQLSISLFPPPCLPPITAPDHAISNCIYAVISFRYVSQLRLYVDAASPEAVPENFNLQMAKLGQGLLSGNYSVQPDLSSDVEVLVDLGIA